MINAAACHSRCSHLNTARESHGQRPSGEIVSMDRDQAPAPRRERSSPVSSLRRRRPRTAHRGRGRVARPGRPGHRPGVAPAWIRCASRSCRTASSTHGTSPSPMTAACSSRSASDACWCSRAESRMPSSCRPRRSRTFAPSWSPAHGYRDPRRHGLHLRLARPGDAWRVELLARRWPTTDRSRRSRWCPSARSPARRATRDARSRWMRPITSG